jgi:DNA-binding NtrC family response regulator
MADTFDFLSPTDQPALLGVSTLEWLGKARGALTELKYKIHTASNQEDFIARFNRTHYQVVLIEESFAVGAPEENGALALLQRMVMGQRRHAVVVLIGHQFATLDRLQAFQQSVHAVVNPRELDQFREIVQQVVADNELFMQSFTEAMVQITTWGK